MSDEHWLAERELESMRAYWFRPPPSPGGQHADGMSRSWFKDIRALIPWVEHLRGLLAAKDAEIARLTKALKQEHESHGETWECIRMAQEAVGSILDEKPESIAPMFLPEAIRSACFRASRGDYDAKCETPTVTPLRADNTRLRAALTEIAKGAGRFSSDPKEHAWNVIRTAVTRAKAALAGAEWDEDMISEEDV